MGRKECLQGEPNAKKFPKNEMLNDLCSTPQMYYVLYGDAAERELMDKCADYKEVREQVRALYANWSIERIRWAHYFFCFNRYIETHWRIAGRESYGGDR
jgi:hypothetical protein